MPKVSVYLPDEVYAEARARGLPVSALAQRAIKDELSRQDVHEWVSRQRAMPSRLHAEIDTAALLDDVRADFGR